MNSMHKREMAVRIRDLRLVDKAKAEKMASIVGGKEVEFVLDSASDGQKIEATLPTLD